MLNRSNITSAELWRRNTVLSGEKEHSGCAIINTDDIITQSDEIVKHMENLFVSLSIFLALKGRAERNSIFFNQTSSKNLYNRLFNGQEHLFSPAPPKCKLLNLDIMNYSLLKHLPPVGKKAPLEIFNDSSDSESIPDKTKAT